MIDKLKANWGLVVIVGSIVMLGLLGGCNIPEMIRNNTQVAVPMGLRDPGQPAKIPLPEAEVDIQKKLHNTELDFGTYAGSIQAANERVTASLEIVNFLTDSALSAYGVQIPGLALLAGAMGLSGAVGAFGIEKPGQSKKLAQEKEASFNAGLKKAKEMVANV